ncbi:MAG: polysulfide reductase NrfD [Thermanaeromonas sp.]|uniref:NrfD/PsrC family molybdoenzyme membrane anchor subunit n=1 Tax=Thermanaeromonas sp. TaxID=2003697 RepID=UPI002438D62F|nr:NrfD/PsrC family molybdoenzyme membrane anchor subunit [Thermanaeromonas sp.]MCG0278840.1 polysulfide reductase NrfD [Thermanaeromonas sp.]
MKQKIWPWAIIIIALAIGSYGLYSRLFSGHLAENYGNYVTWGIWVSAYLYFISISVGSFLVGSVIKQTKRLSRLVALATCIGGLLAIWLDLGHMERFYRALISPNFSSPMAWLVWLYTLYFIVLVWTNYVNFRKGEDEKSGVTSIGIVLVLAVILSSSSLFALSIAKPLWNTAVLPLLFLGVAIASGAASLAILTSMLWPEDKTLLITLKRVILYSLLLTAFLEFSEIFLAAKSGIPEHYEAARSLLAGRYAWPFWLGVVVLAFILPTVLLLPLQSTGTKTVGGYISLLIGLFFLRFLFLVPPQSVTSLKGLENAVMEPRYSYSYFPSIGEWLVTVFLCGLVIAVVLAGLYKFKYLGLAGEKNKEAKISV